MRKKVLNLSLTISITVLFLMIQSGCNSTEETIKEVPPPPPPSATETMQKEMNDLKFQNESLRKKVSECEQAKHTAVARVTEIETQLTEAKEKAQILQRTIQKPIDVNARERYKEGLRLFNARNYADAASYFQSAIDGDITEKLQDNCNYWLGECAYGEKKYNEAIEYFLKVFTFRISEKKDDSQLMIGNSYLAMGDKEKAKEAFEKFTKKFPASPFIKRVKEKLGKL